MNKHIFSLTLLLSVPTALLSAAAIPQKDLALEASVLLAPLWINKAYSDGAMSEDSAGYARLKNMPPADRTCILLKAYLERIKDSRLSEQDSLNAILQTHAYDTAYKFASQYVNEVRAASLARSIKGNVETAIRNNRNCTGYDVAGQFGYNQQVKIIQSLNTDSTGRNTIPLPSIY
jgi:hypothetical protein